MVYYDDLLARQEAKTIFLEQKVEILTQKLTDAMDLIASLQNELDASRHVE